MTINLQRQDESKPEFWGMDKFYSYVGKIIVLQKKKGLRGKVYVTFVVEKMVH
jgi:protein TonB